MSYVKGSTLRFVGILTRLVIVCLIAEVVDSQLVFCILSTSIQHAYRHAYIDRTFLGLLHK